MKTAAEVCPMCGGSGWKSAGADHRVARCECRLKLRGETLLSAARIPKRYEHCELSNFEFDGPHANLMKARMAACRFVEEYSSNNNTGLLLISIGTGKTHLAVGIIKELVASKGIACLFYDYRELLKQIQNSYNDSVKATNLTCCARCSRPSAGARRTRRGEADRMGLGHREPDPEQPLQRQPHHDYYDELSRRCRLRFKWKLRVRPRPAGSPRETLGDRIGERMRLAARMCRIVKMEGETSCRRS